MAAKAPAQVKHRHRPSQDLRFTKGPLTREWEGRTVVLIASGPSLTKAQVNTAKECHYSGEVMALGVNDAYRIAPWIDWLYAADPQWWDVHIRSVRETYIPNLSCQDQDTCQRWGLRWVPGPESSKGHRSEHGLSTDPAFIHFGSHSGFQALNIAFHLGAKRICLLGYDMRFEKRPHWFGDHPQTLQNAHEPGWYARWLPVYDEAAPQLDRAGVDVVNCTPGSAINCFRRATISEALWRV